MTIRAFFSALLLVTAVTLSACGLSPVYGKHAGGSSASGATTGAALDSVYIDNIPDRTGQKLRNLLLDRMYRHGQPPIGTAAWRLKIAGVGESIFGLGIAKDATATRSQIRLTTTMYLVPANDPEQKPALSRNLVAVSSFNTLASQYTTLVTEEDARDQAIRDLSDQIMTQLELYFANPAAFPTTREVEERALARAARDKAEAEAFRAPIDREPVFPEKQ